MNNTFCSKCHRISSQCRCSPVKELTDKEIVEIFRASSDHIEFARAILRKAQEK